MFTEATDYMPVKLSKSSFKGSNKIYTFCLNCGEVDSIRIENTTIFKKQGAILNDSPSVIKQLYYL